MKKILSVILVAVMLLGVVPVMQASAYTYERIYEGNARYFYLTDDDNVEKFLFTPQDSGYYKFFTIGYHDTFVYCFDKDGNEVGFDDDNGYRDNCSCVVYLEKDKDYDFVVSQYNPNGTRQGAMIIRMDMYIQSIDTQKKKDISELFSVRSRFFEFTPQEDGYYAFYSEGEWGGYNMYANLYDSEWNYLDTDEESGVGQQFYLVRYLEKDKKYYFEATHSAEEIYPDPGSVEGDSYYPTESIRVGVEKAEIVSEINITNYPDRMTYYKDFVEESVDYRGLEADLVFTDGRVEHYEYYSATNDIFGATVDVGLSKDENGEYIVCVTAGYGYTEFYLDVLDVTVESLTLNSPPTTVYVLDTPLSGFYDSENPNIYHFHPDDPEGISLTVNFSDGTNKTYTDADFVHNSTRLDGYRFSIKRMEITQSGTYQAEFSYLGHTLTYDVEIMDKIEVRGDVDRDGVLTVMDATEIQRYLVGLVEFDAAQVYTANTYNTGYVVDILDVTHIQQYLAGLVWRL